MNFTILSSHIFTGDPSRPRAEAIAVREGRIVAVGNDQEIRDGFPESELELKMPGRLITPGLVDSHTHFNRQGMVSRWVKLKGAASIAECREKIRKAVETYPPGRFIIGWGWNQNEWSDGREPTRRDLDDIAPDHPIMLIRICGHCLWVNSKALAVAGVNSATPDPPGGRIDREGETGEPNGLIREARYLIQDAIPPSTLKERVDAALIAQEEALRLGITGVHTMETLDEWEAFHALDQDHRLKMRVYFIFPAGALDQVVERGITSTGGTDRLWYGHAKLYADGSLGARTALLHDPYNGRPGEKGIPFLTPDELTQNVQHAYSLGWHAAIHAIGDQAVTNALQAISRARQNFRGSHRDRIEHIQLCRSEDLDRFRSQGIIASVQPSFVPSDWRVAEELWGPERCRNAYAWKSILDNGIPMQFGSDAPIESINPLLGLQAAVTRQDAKGNPEGGWFPAQRLTLEESIRSFTVQPAITAGRSDLGTISPGKWADLTVFEQDLFALPPGKWPGVEVELTVVQGEIAYRKA